MADQTCSCQNSTKNNKDYSSPRRREEQLKDPSAYRDRGLRSAVLGSIQPAEVTSVLLRDLAVKPGSVASDQTNNRNPFSNLLKEPFPVAVPCQTMTLCFLQVAWRQACHEPRGLTASPRTTSETPLRLSASFSPGQRQEVSWEKRRKQKQLSLAAGNDPEP
ncbi:Mini-chromosome maintenance complex-binding protein [Dissostichus eleginoides]|uniref:Mini-chromosome maintenance complex-binding protein n=1 Tax=Dissostichus eleginoides TaxID=100907 RepID=A0AAD9BGN4_DISEL|nr:Mini-chromosome maintenance complex-binding protein [Dissostichus eleginoides]